MLNYLMKPIFYGIKTVFVELGPSLTVKSSYNINAMGFNNEQSIKPYNSSMLICQLYICCYWKYIKTVSHELLHFCTFAIKM